MTNSDDKLLYNCLIVLDKLIIYNGGGFILDNNSNVSLQSKLFDMFSHKLIRSIALQGIYFIMGVLVSRSVVLGSYAPFGTAFIAATPYANIWFALSGAVFGYILPSPVTGNLRYIASVLAIVAIRWTLNDLKRVTSHALYAPIVAFIPTLATGLAMAVIQGVNSASIITVITESMLAASGAYFFAKSISVTSVKLGISTMDQQEFACVSMATFIMILSLSGISISGISIGRIIAVLIILICSRYAGVAGGSVSGIASGIVFSISSTNFLYLSGAYAFSGMMAGLFSPLGEIGLASAFILSNAIVSLQSGDLTLIITGLYEVMASTLIFMLIPQSKMDRLSGLFDKKTEHVKIDALRNSVTMRLDQVARALDSVANSVDSVSRKLSKLITDDFKWVFTRAIDENCHRCGLKVFCWEKEYDYTKKIFKKIKEPLIKNGSVSSEDFSSEFATRCCKAPEMVRSVNRNYDEYLAKGAASRRMGELRGIIGEQFSGLGGLLKDISKEFKNYESFDIGTSEKVMSFLKSAGMMPVDISCRINKFSRMSIEIELINLDKRKINKLQLVDDLSRVCAKRLDTPCISYSPERCKIQIGERPDFDIEISAAQHVYKNGKLCGDNYCYFNDGMGRAVAIISDGMGTGGRAAVDGAMTTGILAQLIKAGLGFDSALRIVNSALIVKSGDESLSTIDISCIDLFTGEVQFMKAGAPVTFVKKNGGVVCIEAPSLPAGILTNIDFSRANIKIEEEDLILMISDGALGAGDRWIETELKNWNNTDIGGLANYIVDEAVKRRLDNYDDDITVLVARLKEY